MKVLLLVIISFSLGLLQAQTHHFDSISNINYWTLHSANLNDCWGYVDETGVEYALVGTTKGISIVSLADPSNPVEIFWEPGTESVWRDLQVYGDFAYITTEADDGLLIIDLSPLPVSTTLPTSYYFGTVGPNYWSSAHDIFIDTTGGWAYICGANRGNGGLIILDIHTNPMVPVEVGTFDTWYCHDAFAQGNLLYGAHISDGYLSVIDITDHSNPLLINTITTPNAFTHNVWVTSNDQFAVTTDEIRGAFITLYDVSDPMNILEMDRVQSTAGSPIIPHNAFILRDSFIVTSYYTDGIVMHNMNRPGNIVEVASYDSNPLNTPEFNGSWGVYPFLPSGHFLASDMTTGLHVVKPTNFSASYFEGLVRDASTLNPLNNAKIEIIGEENSDFTNVSGEFAVGTPTFGTLQVRVSKVAYYTQVLTINFVADQLILDTIDLVPIPPLPIQINVVESGTSTPIIGANVLVHTEEMDVNAVSNGFGEANMIIYYPGINSVTVGKWGYVTKCAEYTIDASNSILTIELVKGYYDDFTFDNSWSISGTATKGIWERGVPFESFTTVVPQEDALFDCGDQCYLTGNMSTYAPNVDNLHDGKTILISPLMDLTGLATPYLNFDYWFYNYFGPNLVDDTLRVFISNGLSTVEVFKVGNTGSVQTWKYESVLLTDFISMTNTMRVTFQTSDSVPNGNITEAAIDGFSISNIASASLESKDKIIFEIYPNPLSSNCIIESNYSSDLKVFNSLGKVEKIVPIESGKNQIELKELPTGVYWIELGENRKMILKQ